MKKNYQKPTMQVAEIEQTNIICASPTMKRTTTNLTGNDAIQYGGGGSGPARSRNLDCDDEGDGSFLKW